LVARAAVLQALRCALKGAKVDRRAWQVLLLLLLLLSCCPVGDSSEVVMMAAQNYLVALQWLQ
jgi:hypothetical protein